MKNSKIDIKKFIPHLSAIIIILVVCGIYFYPQLDGYLLSQSDHVQYLGMSKEINDFRDNFHEEPLWTNSMFSGMPAYQISLAGSNIIGSIKNLVLEVIPRPIGYLFFMMIGFYILLLCFNVSPWVSLIGAIAFGLASFNMLYLGNGHNTKIHALSFIPPIIGAFIYSYRKNMIVGSLLLSIFICLHLAANHLQMTYYMLFLLLALFITEFIRYYKESEISKFIKVTAFVILAALLGITPNITNIWVTYEYGKYTTRGKSELTVLNAESSDIGTDAKGLDKDYIKQYSLGYGEVWSAIIPNIKGGSMGYLGNNPEVMETVDPNLRSSISKQYSYWGEQYGSGGAFYYGASVFLLFLLGMFFLKDKSKWAFLSVSILAVILSWKYSAILDFFIDSFPLFNKFRDTKMMLILIQVSFPFIGFLFINKLINDNIDKKKFLYISASFTGLLVLFYALPNLFFDFLSQGDANQFNSLFDQYKNNPGTIKQIESMMSALEGARIIIYKADVLRSILFVAATGLTIYLFLIKKLSKVLLLSIIALIVTIDLWTIDKRYLNNEKTGRDYAHWVTAEKYDSPLNATAADLEILKSETAVLPDFKNKVEKEFDLFKKGKKFTQAELKTEYDKIQFMELNLATNYRVFTIQNPFNSSRTSYFHKAIGGYHGAKLKKYQEVISFHISKEYENISNVLNSKPNNTDLFTMFKDKMPVLNMLNTKYIIFNEASRPLLNPYQFGNAWFVNKVNQVETADDELLALSNVNMETIIIRKNLMHFIDGKVNSDSTAIIRMESYLPNHITYKSKSTKDNVAVFSEIYYKDGWNAYIDGNKSDYFSANYILRAIAIPAGEHVIEFKFEPSSYYTSRNISVAGSVLIILFALSIFFMEFIQRRKEKVPEVKE